MTSCTGSCIRFHALWVCMCVSCQYQPWCVAAEGVTSCLCQPGWLLSPANTLLLQCSSGMTGPVTLCKVCHNTHTPDLAYCLERCHHPALCMSVCKGRVCFRLMVKTSPWATADSGISLPLSDFHLSFPVLSLLLPAPTLLPHTLRGEEDEIIETEWLHWSTGLTHCAGLLPSRCMCAK